MLKITKFSFISPTIAPLGERSRLDLHNAIAEYLRDQGWDEALQQFLTSSGTSPPPQRAGTANGGGGVLEKKFTTVLRLQKKVLELESKVESLVQELASAPQRPSSSTVSGMPSAPPKHTLLGHRAQIHGVTFHPFFTLLATASEDATIKVWDYDSGTLEKTLRGHQDAVMGVAYDSTGRLLASCSSDCSARLWDCELYEVKKSLMGHDRGVSSVVFAGDVLVTASRDFSVRIWDMATGYCVRALWEHEEWVRCLSPYRDGVFASGSSDQSAIVWSAGGNGVLARLRGHTHVVECLAFAPLEAEANVSKAFSVEGKAPQGPFVVTGSRDRSVRVWDVASGVCLQVIEGHDSWVRAVAFHPNGEHVISTGDDKSVRVWELNSGREVKRLADAHPKFIGALVFKAAGGTGPSVMATAGVDGGVRVWRCE